MVKQNLLQFSDQNRMLFYNKTKPDIISDIKTYRFVQLIVALILIKHKHGELWNQILTSGGKNLLSNRDFPMEKRFLDIKYIAEIKVKLIDLLDILQHENTLSYDNYQSLRNEVLSFCKQLRFPNELDDKYRFTIKPQACPACGYHV